MKKLIKTLFLSSCIAFSAFGLTACGPEGVRFGATELGTAKEATALTYEERKNYKYSDINEAAETFAADFASLAYKKYEKEANFAVSPLSAYMALSLAAQCSVGETQSEILSVLGISYEQLINGFSDYYRSVFNEYTVRGEDGDKKLSGMVDITNSVWIDSHSTYKQDCIDILADRFFCNSFGAEFKDKNDEANRAVRQFVSDKTRGLIDRNFNLSPDTAFALINTLYLKDVWNAFGNELSFTDRNYIFTQSDGSKKETKLLQGYYTQGRVYKDTNFKTFYTLTENGNRIDFIVPEEGYTVKDVFTAENITKVKNIKDYNAIDNDKKEIYCTRCLFPEYSASYDGRINQIVEKLGVKLFFDANRCDFSHLTDDKVFCDEIIHATELKVNRKGIEGAAVTIIAMDTSAAPPDEYTNIYQDFVIDRSFGFILSDRHGNTLFSGAVENI